MIKIDRNRIPMPKVLGPDKESPGMRETTKAIEFYKVKIESRSQRRFLFKTYKHRVVKDALTKLFYNKCAYCESKFVSAPMDVDQYRPKGGVIGTDGTHYADYYFWLANEWTNLFTACHYCNRKNKVAGSNGKLMMSGKGNQFPLENEKNRASYLGIENDLKKEEPLILNPCDDDPDKHLIFLEDGTVVSETKKGQTSIEILGLNRESLVIARSNKIRQIDSAKEILRSAIDNKDSIAIKDGYKILNKFIDPDQEFTGLSRQYIKNNKLLYEEITDVDVEWDQRNINLKVFDDLLNINPDQRKKKTQKASKAFKSFQQEQQNYSLESNIGLEKYFSGPARFVEHVSIRNLKSIKSLDIDLTGGSSDDVPWTMILGENGTGKSTILQAITMALIGQSYFNELAENNVFDPASFLRWETEKGSVSVRITGFSKPRKVFFYSGGRVEFTDSESAQNLVLAYGSTRLMPRGETNIEYGRDYARVENLFNPFLPMANANLWLSSLPEDRFTFAALELKKLLKLPAKSYLHPIKNIIYMQTEDGKVPITNLSDGYQSTLALIADILKVVLSKWPTPESAQGIVLLDEVGNHLHPEWKMRFVSEMRAFFPGLQFIATTHNPLCLYGLQDGEVAVVKRSNTGTVYQVDDLPTITGLRVDQLLTSEHFGLGSATDPETQSYLDEYYKLLRNKKKSEVKSKRISELKAIIDKRQQLGKTERERMMLEVIDQFLADKRFRKTVSEEKKLKDDTMNKLREIWES